MESTAEGHRLIAEAPAVLVVALAFLVQPIAGQWIVFEKASPLAPGDARYQVRDAPATGLFPGMSTIP